MARKACDCNPAPHCHTSHGCRPFSSPWHPPALTHPHPQDAASVTTTAAKAGYFEARFFHKVRHTVFSSCCLPAVWRACIGVTLHMIPNTCQKKWGRGHGAPAGAS